MNAATIGDEVRFASPSGWLAGRVVGSEIVLLGDWRQRDAGRWLLVSVGRGEAVELPETAVRAVATENMNA
jgi:hypothetical protein